MFLLKILTLVILLVILVQDFRTRSVYWFLFPCLALMLFLLNFGQHNLLAQIWQAIAINCCFFFVQLLVVSIYFSIKNRGWVNVTNGLLGWGDILFLFCITFYLSVFNFLFFYISSLIGILLIWMLWQTISREKNKQIPLAGLQALIFAVFLATDWWFNSFGLTSDHWLLRLIMK